MKSILQAYDDRCWACKKAFGTETHHAIGGPARKWSEKDGLTLRLCRECHNEAHKGGFLTDWIHTYAQTKWEEVYGPGLRLRGEDVRKAWIERYGKNYL